MYVRTHETPPGAINTHVKAFSYALWTYIHHFYLFIYCGLFPLILVVFCVVSSFTTFRPNSLWPSSGDFTATSDRNAESCKRIPSNYCLPSHHFHRILSIAPRFWPSKPLAGLGRIWNRYLLTVLTWNQRDSTPLSAAPWAPKGDQGWIFWSHKSLSGLPESGPYRFFVRTIYIYHIWIDMGYFSIVEPKQQPLLTLFSLFFQINISRGLIKYSEIMLWMMEQKIWVKTYYDTTSFKIV